jgi:group I intron endonuclease
MIAMTKGLDTYTNIVYEIKNKVNGKRYIGITTNTFNERYPHGIRAHHNPHLRNSVKKYGQENFEVILLEKNVEDMETLCKLEEMYIKKYDTCNPDKGYNKSLGGLGVRLPHPFTEEHCRNLSEAKKGINPLRNYTPEQMARRNAKLSKSLSGKNNPRYGMTKDKLKPETIEKLRQAALGKNNPMYGKNIKDYMTEEAYEEWKLKVARHGRMNGRARKTIVVYKGQEYVFDYCRQAINYFKDKGEPITVNWIYRGINPNYQDRFQFFGYEEDYKKYKENKALAI